ASKAAAYHGSGARCACDRPRTRVSGRGPRSAEALPPPISAQSENSLARGLPSGVASRMLRFVVVLLASVLLFTTASAQGTWFQTGTLTTRIGGVEREHNTYGTLVPEDVAEGVEDPQQRAILERIA